MEVRLAEASDAGAVIALLAALGRPPVIGGDEQAAVFCSTPASQLRAIVGAIASSWSRTTSERRPHQLYESYGFTFGGRAYGPI
jgi:hypothetical protein